MVLYDEDGVTVTAQWNHATNTFHVTQSWMGCLLDRSEHELITSAVDQAERYAGVSRLSSLWTWRLLDEQTRPIRPFTGSQYEWTSQPWKYPQVQA